MLLGAQLLGVVAEIQRRTEGVNTCCAGVWRTTATCWAGWLSGRGIFTETSTAVSRRPHHQLM